ncbi:hypothetical protein PAXRUDRAFT_821983, partial [Paxillus rubicundulus Ve08.2h10]
MRRYPRLLNVSDHSDKDALIVLFAECSRFHQLTPHVQHSPCWDDITMEGLTQLGELSVHALLGVTALARADEFKAIFSLSSA